MVVDLSESGPRPFDFDASCSRTQMADSIWGMMDQ